MKLRTQKDSDFDNKRREDGVKIIDLLSSIQSKVPELRVGQIIDNALVLYYSSEIGWGSIGLFYIENDVLLDALSLFITSLGL